MTVDRPWGCQNRHWFTVRGLVGVRRHDCSRCGAPNPNWKPGTPCWRCDGEGFIRDRSAGSHTGSSLSECPTCDGAGKIG